MMTIPRLITFVSAEPTRPDAVTRVFADGVELKAGNQFSNNAKLTFETTRKGMTVAQSLINWILR
jgi:hypothetical protein